MPKGHHSLKKIVLLPLIPLILLTFGSLAKAQTPMPYSEKTALNLVWESKLQDCVEHLCDSLLTGRATGTPGNTDATYYLISQLQKIGLLPLNDSYVQCFPIDGNAKATAGHNVVGMIPGSLKRSGSSSSTSKNPSYIVVGAHYDHIGTLAGKFYPGADSNASGVTALISLAEMFNSMKILGKTYNSSIIFVAFDAKELSMAGSYAFWNALKLGRLSDPVTGRKIMAEDIKMMVNIDQIGATLSPLHSGREDYIIMLGEQSLPKSSQGQLSLCNRYYDVDLELATTYYGSENFTKVFYTISDQRPFVENGIPAVMFTSGITMNNNKTYDTPSSLNYPVLRRRINLIYFWINRIISRQSS